MAATKKAATRAPRAKHALVTDFEDTRRRALLCIDAADDKKSEGTVALDLRGLCNFTDVFLLFTGGSTLQVRAIADNVIERMKADGSRSPIVDGESGTTWIVIDFGDIVAHVMTPETREFYNLEGLWGDAPAVKATA